MFLVSRSSIQILTLAIGFCVRSVIFVSQMATELPLFRRDRLLDYVEFNLAGWPKRSFHEMIELSAADEANQAALQHLCPKEG